MEFLIAAGGMTLIMFGIAIWALRADKRDEERERQQAAKHAHETQK